MNKRLSWNGNQEAQDQADAAYAKLLNSANKKRSKSTSKRKSRKKKQKRGRGPEKFQVTCSDDYRRYLETNHWKNRRKQKLAVHKRCEVCGSASQLQVHHKSYQRLWREKDKDLEVLCSGCHENEHESDKGTCDPMTVAYLNLMNVV